jgi:hypothetical protein
VPSSSWKQPPQIHTISIHHRQSTSPIRLAANSVYHPLTEDSTIPAYRRNGSQSTEADMGRRNHRGLEIQCLLQIPRARAIPGTYCISTISERQGLLPTQRTRRALRLA